MSDQTSPNHPDNQGTNPFEPTGSPDPTFEATPSHTPPPPPPHGIGSEHTAYNASTPLPPGATQGYARPVQPMSAESERQIGALGHAIGAGAYVLSAGTLGFVAALVMYLMFRDRGSFVRANLANALNVQIMTGIASVVAWIMIATLIGAIVGVPLLLAAGAYCVIVHIIGAVKAMNGELWIPPLTPQFIK